MSHSNTELDDDQYASVSSRVESFRGCSLAEKVPPQRMARAGFFYTGHDETVQCFSCSTTLNDWKVGDSPVAKHITISPKCRFISCIYSDDPAEFNGEYDEEAEDLDFCLRTGQVVDEGPTYAKAPHMRSEEARLQTFSKWPISSHMRPSDLARAGLYYSGTSDHVQCFCCSGLLGNWEPGDEAWSEHERLYPSCFFVLGHDVGNEPLQGGSQEESKREVYMESYEERLQSFQGNNHPISHERLAQAGLYKTGKDDRVTCFSCGGGLKGWQPDEDPWEEHAKHYPGCSFLLKEKGQEFIASIQLKVSVPTSHQNGLYTDSGDEPLTQMREEEDPIKKLEKLQREKQCKICYDRDICMVFIPCGHLVSCKECSSELRKCPICCNVIEQKIKAFLS